MAGEGTQNPALRGTGSRSPHRTGCPRGHRGRPGRPRDRAPSGRLGGPRGARGLARREQLLTGCSGTGWGGPRDRKAVTRAACHPLDQGKPHEGADRDDRAPRYLRRERRLGRLLGAAATSPTIRNGLRSWASIQRSPCASCAHYVSKRAHVIEDRDQVGFAVRTRDVLRRGRVAVIEPGRTGIHCWAVPSPGWASTRPEQRVAKHPHPRDPRPTRRRRIDPAGQSRLRTRSGE